MPATAEQLAPDNLTKTAIATMSSVLSQGGGIDAVTLMVRGMHVRNRGKFLQGVLNGCGDDYDSWVRDLTPSQLVKLFISVTIQMSGKVRRKAFSAAVGFPRPWWYKENEEPEFE